MSMKIREQLAERSVGGSKLKKDLKDLAKPIIRSVLSWDII